MRAMVRPSEKMQGQSQERCRRADGGRSCARSCLAALHLLSQAQDREKEAVPLLFEFHDRAPRRLLGDALDELLLNLRPKTGLPERSPTLQLARPEVG